MNVHELKASDPKRFKREYEEWREEGPYDDWWEFVQEGLRDDCADYGITVQDIQFNLGYSQSDYAAFTGQVDVAEWMRANGDDVKYPALYVAIEDYREYAPITVSRGGFVRVEMVGEVVSNTYPTGIFKHLDNVTWDELIAEQYDMANLDDAIQDWVRKRCHKLYRELRDEYEHLTSEESFIEYCECNEITFEENANEVCS